MSLKNEMMRIKLLMMDAVVLVLLKKVTLEVEDL